MDAMKHALVLVNPGAGNGDVASLRSLLVAALEHHGWSYEFEVLEKGVHISQVIERLQHAVQHNTRLVIACGGDGTNSLVASAIIKADLRQQLTLGIFPSGTANSLAKELGIPVDWSAAANLLCSETPSTHLDAMKMGERYCFLRIGIGLDAETIGETTREAKRHLGRWAYLKSFLSRFFQPKRLRYTCHIDGKRHRFWAVQVFIANGGNIALAPFRIGPDIQFNDGIVNLCAYDALNWWDYFTVGWKLLRKNYQTHPLLKFYLARRSIRVHSKRTVMVQADGETCAQTPIDIQVIPQAVQVIANPVQPAGG